MTKKKKLDAAGEIIPPQPTDRTPDQHRIALKKKVRYFYDMQRLRLQMSGRLYKRPEGSTIDLHEWDIKVLEGAAKELHAAEKKALKVIIEHLKTIPFFTEILNDKVKYKGIGPTMAGVILSEFNIHRQETASQMWSFAGLAPIPSLRCKKCHGTNSNGTGHHDSKIAEKECGILLLTDDLCYASGKSMRPTKGEKLPYNAFLKTKLVGVLGSVLLQVNSPWRSFYDSYKLRKQNQAGGWGRSDGHRHQASIRYMVKMLLLQIHKDWRTFENLPLRPSYQEEYLGHTHKTPEPKIPPPPKLALVEEVSPEIAAEIAAEVEIANEFGG